MLKTSRTCIGHEVLNKFCIVDLIEYRLHFSVRFTRNLVRNHAFVINTSRGAIIDQDALIDALHDQGFAIAMESNGTIAAHPGIDWVCISPKAGSEVVQRRGDELKLVWPQDHIDIDSLEHWDFANFLVQPMDSAAREENLRAAIAFAMARPRWRLTLQTHKMLGLP